MMIGVLLNMIKYSINGDEELDVIRKFHMFFSNHP